MQMAMIRLWPERHKLDNFRLATVARHLDIEFDENSLHNALADVLLARKVFYELCE